RVRPQACMTLVWRARALNDRRSLFAPIARDTDPGHAYDVLTALRTQIEALLDQPALGRRGHQRTTVRVRGRDLHLRYRVEGSYVRQGAGTQHLYRLVVGYGLVVG